MTRSIPVRNAVVSVVIAVSVGGWTATSIAQVPNEQRVPAPQTAPPTAAQPLEENKVDQFVDAYLAIEEVHSNVAAELDAADDPVEEEEIRDSAENRMIQAVQRTGMPLEEFNRIIELMALNPGLRETIANRVEERRPI